MRILRNVVLAAVLAGLSPMAISAEQQSTSQPQRPAAQRGRGQGVPGARAGMPIQQLQALFDAHVLVQAQRVLQLPDDQYQRFFVRMNRLQEVRRQHVRRRNQLINELRRKWSPEADEAELVTLTRQLEEVETTFESEQRTARRALDEVLTPRQLARFRFFEEDMERQKIEFITLSRQAPSPDPPGPRRGGGGG
jgi:Spy/CpxP family protein refolding chaperone